MAQRPAYRPRRRVVALVAPIAVTVPAAAVPVADPARARPRTRPRRRPGRALDARARDRRGHHLWRHDRRHFGDGRGELGRARLDVGRRRLAARPAAARAERHDARGRRGRRRHRVEHRQPILARRRPPDREAGDERPADQHDEDDRRNPRAQAVAESGLEQSHDKEGGERRGRVQTPVLATKDRPEPVAAAAQTRRPGEGRGIPPHHARLPHEASPCAGATKMFETGKAPLSPRPHRQQRRRAPLERAQVLARQPRDAGEGD